MTRHNCESFEDGNDLNLGAVLRGQAVRRGQDARFFYIIFFFQNTYWPAPHGKTLNLAHPAIARQRTRTPAKSQL